MINRNMNIEARIGQIPIDQGLPIHSDLTAASEAPTRTTSATRIR